MSLEHLAFLADWYSCKWGYVNGHYGRACCVQDGLIHFVVDTPPFPKVWVREDQFEERPRT